MDLGTGIAIGTVAVSAGAVAVKALSNNGRPKQQEVCPIHHTIEESLKGMWQAVNVIQQDIKELLKR